MKASGFKIDGDSLRVSLSLNETSYDTTERVELSAARQRLSINKSNALTKSKVGTARPKQDSFDNSVVALEKQASTVSRGFQQVLEFQTELSDISTSLETLESRRSELYSRKVALLQSLAVLKNKLSANFGRKPHCKGDQQVSDLRLILVDAPKSDNGVLCPFFLMGECADSECLYFHPEK